jgi:hypothetical protein
MPVQSFTFSPAQVAALNSFPPELFPAVEGVFVLPTRVRWSREGAPYATQPGALQVRYVTASPFAHMQAAAAGILTSQAEWMSFAGGTGQYGLDEASAVGLRGKALQLFAAVGNPTVTEEAPGSDLTLEVTYEEL